MAQILTRLQQDTVSRLKSNDWGAIKQSDVTRLLSKILDSKEQSVDLIPKVIEYEKVTHPQKDIKWIEKYISGKLKSKPDRIMFKEVLKSGDYSSIPDKKKKQPVVPSTIQEQAPLSDFSTMKDSKTKKTGTDEQLNKVLESILNNKIETKESFQGQGRTVGGKKDKTQSKIFEGTGEFYTKNKATIDKLKKSLTKEKIKDGSWFEGVVGLAAPELAVVGELLKGTPLGMSKQDKINLQKMLNGEDPGDGGTLSFLKSLVNPEGIGQVLSSSGEKIIDKAGTSLSDFWSKITTGKGLVAPKAQGEIDTAKLIQSRRDELDAKEKRKKELEELGIKTDYEKAWSQGHRDLTIKEDALSADQIAAAPQLALEQTTAWDDFVTGLQGVFGIRSTVANTPEKMRAYLQQNNPKYLQQFDEQVKSYDDRLKKINLSADSAIDIGLHGSMLKYITDYNRSLIKTASSLKELTSDQIEQIYDINATLENVMTGKRTLSYDDLQNAMNTIYSITPAKVFKELGGDRTKILQEGLKYNLGMKFKGDSDLTNVDKILEDKINEGKKEIIDEKELKEPEETEPEPEEPEPDNKINEKPLDESSSSDTQDTSWSDLRPRLYEGGTDKLIYRSAENVKLSNLVAAASQIAEPGWGNGADSSMFLKNQIDYKLRYDYTIPMRPIIKPYKPPVPRYRFENAGWNSVLAPLNEVDDDMTYSMRCASDIQPFLYFTPSIPQTPYLIFNQLEDYPSFPHQRNDRMPCENLNVYNAKLQNLVVRKRTKK
jgi:hypothetical protein